MPLHNIKIHSTYIMLDTKSSPSNVSLAKSWIVCRQRKERKLYRLYFWPMLLSWYYSISILTIRDEEFQLTISIKENLFTLPVKQLCNPFHWSECYRIGFDSLNGSCFDIHSPEAIRVWSYSDSVIPITTKDDP